MSVQILVMDNKIGKCLGHIVAADKQTTKHAKETIDDFKQFYSTDVFYGKVSIKNENTDLVSAYMWSGEYFRNNIVFIISEVDNG